MYAVVVDCPPRTKRKAVARANCAETRGGHMQECPRATVTICYDFDGALIPGNMQENS